MITNRIVVERIREIAEQGFDEENVSVNSGEMKNWAIELEAALETISNADYERMRMRDELNKLNSVLAILSDRRNWIAKPRGRGYVWEWVGTKETRNPLKIASDALEGRS